MKYKLKVWNYVLSLALFQLDRNYKAYSEVNEHPTRRGSFDWDTISSDILVKCTLKFLADILKQKPEHIKIIK